MMGAFDVSMLFYFVEGLIIGFALAILALPRRWFR
jgi:hypothetical protein